MRALAVVPVILFHAGFELFGGGFVGVDVFFVISGYLITTILIEDLENDRFSIINFYERRARRILPALFFIMLACIPFAWMWMEPSRMLDFSQSLVAVSIFASNILFWRESGYFDTAAEEKPLLHTWSLAVEEQYYLLFPIFLILAWRFGKNKVFWMIVVIAAISLLLTEWGWRNKAKANFYLLPTRAWEIFAGSITAFIVQKKGVQKNNTLALLGLVAIFFAIFVYDESTPFPSIYALVPVIGTMLLILYADKKTIVAKLLSIKALVGIGLISYSAYLWHQPLFAFTRIRMLEHPSEMLMLVLSLISLALAYYSWKFIERPFRNKVRISRRSLFIILILLTLVFVLIGYYGHKQNGFKAKEVELFSPNIEKIFEKSNQNTLPVYVIGDSHARHLLKGISLLSGKPVINMTSVGCIPFRDVDRYDSRFKPGACAQTINKYLNTLKDVTTPSAVILSSMGPVYLDGTTFNNLGDARVKGLGVDLITDKSITNHYDVFEIGMRNTLAELSLNSNLEIIFALDIPELGINFGCKNSFKRISLFGLNLNDLVRKVVVKAENCNISRHSYDERTMRYKALVFSILEDYPSVNVFDPTPYFCDDEKCYGFMDDYGFIYGDIDHLNKNGSIYYAEKLIGSFEFFKNK